MKMFEPEKEMLLAPKCERLTANFKINEWSKKNPQHLTCQLQAVISLLISIWSYLKTTQELEIT